MGDIVKKLKNYRDNASKIEEEMKQQEKPQDVKSQTDSRDKTRGRRYRLNSIKKKSQKGYNKKSGQSMTISLDEMLKLANSETKRCYLGFEYECPLGHRFFLNTDLIAENWPHVIKNGKLDLPSLLNSDVGLYMMCPCGKNSMSQLQRLFIVTCDCPSLLCLNPRVMFKSANNPGPDDSSLPIDKSCIFDLGLDVILPNNSFICLRLPYIYSYNDQPLIQKGVASPYIATLLSSVVYIAPGISIRNNGS